MWKKFYDLVERVLTLSTRVSRHESQIDELRREMRELSALVYGVVARQEAERENTRLWIENQLLRFEQKQLMRANDDEGKRK
ncbi:MAG: hypothetical protein MSG64_17065 [Pyrinomonadaceae bacterium MAG19_C2-C3]|nr:hypothetical protein [Pyrinomonadaceae bacterium MAG19_C2-C3]